MMLKQKYTLIQTRLLLTPATCHDLIPFCLLGGSWVAISGVISRVAIVITHIRGLIAPLTTTHEPPSNSARKLDQSDPRFESLSRF